MAYSTQDPKCIFCRIVAGEIPSARVLETELAVVFLDINPLHPGHVLLVPKPHHAQLLDLPEELAGHCGALLPSLCRAVKAAIEAEGVNVVINNGTVAGQTIDHCHWHIIPRSVGDRIHWPWPQGTYGTGELERLRARIASLIDRKTEAG